MNLLHFSKLNGWNNDAYDSLRNTVLKCKNVGNITIELICPHMKICLRVEKLTCNSYTSAGFPNAPFKHLANA